MWNFIWGFIAGGVVVFIGLGIICERMARKKEKERRCREGAGRDDWEPMPNHSVGEEAPTPCPGHKEEP
jgi:hypothetical protein